MPLAKFIFTAGLTNLATLDISSLNKTSSTGITPFEYSINKTKSPFESTVALPLQKSIKGSMVLPCKTSSWPSFIALKLAETSAVVPRSTYS